MVFGRHVLAMLVGGTILASCAQQEPQSVTIEPYYDKVSGASCEAGLYLDTSQQDRVVCREECPQGSSSVTSATGQRLCVPSRCPPGTTPAAGTAGRQCVPIDDGGDQPQGQRDPQTPGFGG
ncbi:MAG: hypothetical protein MUE98_12200 [Rhodobacteraceae bacterium]|nr:hypothetical protein [Paracoccaceae bacterium]